MSLECKVLVTGSPQYSLYLLIVSRKLQKHSTKGSLENNISTLKGCKYQLYLTTNITTKYFLQKNIWMNCCPMETIMIQFYVLINSVLPQTKFPKYSPKGPYVTLAWSYEPRIVNNIKCSPKLELILSC